LIVFLCLPLLNGIAGLPPSVVFATASDSPQAWRNIPDNEVSQVSASQATTTVLKLGEPVKREIKGSEAHSFSIVLMPEQYAQLTVRWQGVNLDVAVLQPDGKRLIEPDVKVIAPGPVPIMIIADVPGDYRLELRPTEKSSGTGNYEIQLEVVRAQTPADKSHFSAQQIMAEARRQESKEAAVEKYKQALPLWRAAGDAYGEAHTLQSLGEASVALKQWKDATDYYTEALGVRRKDKDRRSEAYALKDLGGAYQDGGSAEDARKQFEQALQIFRALGDRREEAGALYSVGFAYQLIGKMEEALEHYQSALAIQRAEGYRLEEARTINSMGGVHQILGNLDEALSLYQQAAPVWRALGDRFREAITINNIGVVYDDWGDWQQARERYTEALSICRTLPNKSSNSRRFEASILDNIGELYNSLGDPGTALEKFQESLAIRQELKQPRGLGTTLARIGYAFFLQGKPEKALEYYALALLKHQEAGDLRSLALTRTFIGMAYGSLNDQQKALDYYQQALQLQESSGERRAQAITLDKMGHAYDLTRNWKKAFESYDRALQLWREVKDQDGETITLYNIASAERARGNLLEAHHRIEKALQIIESRRVNLTSAQLRTAYFANKENYYELAIDLKMQLSKSGDREAYVPAALAANERSHARNLLDILSEARVGLRESGDERQGTFDLKLAEMLNRKQALQRKLNIKAKTQTSLLGGKRTDEQAASISKEITEIVNEYDEVEARIKAYNPRYAALAQPQPLNAREIQQELLDDKTLLLEYALGDERSYLWVVTPTSIDGYELPKRADIEKVAGRIKDILASCRKLPGELGSHYQARLAEAYGQYRPAATSLSQMLLEPVAARLGNKRLIIVAEGDLQYIPFGGLPVPATAASSAEQAAMASPDGSGASAPLALDHEIINLPSASVLALIRSEIRHRQLAPKAVAVLADPVFEKDDTRLPAAHKVGETVKQQWAKPEALSRALEDLDVLNDNLRLPRLYSSRQEAADIMAAAPPNGRLEAIDFKASRALATDPLLAQYRIIHFATHGLLDDKHPELSGIVLSLFDEQGRPQEDGFLRLHDIYNLKLPVELVVLSACQTGLGKKMKGEGLIGLTRGFMYAGAARVIASLWKVDDAATAELMKRFYKAMFKDKMTPAAALRAAQVSMWKQPRWRNPYFWSGFILQGEWR
jgi:CHAT domain-containing protein/tetratricopeptide (TPR) repeat protein